MDSSTLAAMLPDETVPILTGCFAFGTTLALSTLAQKMLGISTATKILPSLIGMATVAFASLASQRVAMLGHEWCRNPEILQDPQASRRILASSSFQDSWKIGKNIRIPKHDVRVCLTGMLAFKILGGRFWAIAPSSYTNLGSFARKSLPATEKYISSTQRPALVSIGKKSGCHTCGTRVAPSYIGDHMPPKSIAEKQNETWLRRKGLLPKIEFRFYPHCKACSNKQGSILSVAGRKASNSGLPMINQARALKESGGGRQAYFHGLRLRLSHITGGFLAGLTVVGASEREIAKGHPERFERLEKKVRNGGKKIKGSIQ